MNANKNASEHYAVADDLLDDRDASVRDLLRAIGHGLLALVETEETGAHEIHQLAEAIHENVVEVGAEDEAEGGGGQS